MTEFRPEEERNAGFLQSREEVVPGVRQKN